ncbi:MAG TPA: DEAD/DEAH box helicase [Waddliaceae bacterium]
MQVKECIALRDYQQECIEAVLSEFNEMVFRQLISLPTGSGKTVILGSLAQRLNKKTILLAHREELIIQAVEKFKLVWPEVDIGICMGDFDEIHTQVVIGSIQSCSRPKRLERLKEQGFEIMMIDEAHHSISQSYQTVINELGFNVKDQNKLLLGVTATVSRSDKISLGNTYDKIVFLRSISTMILGGFLSPVIGRRILTSFNLNGVKTDDGDFCLGALAEAVDVPERNDFIAEKFKEFAADRKAIVFGVNVAHCKALSESFRKLGFNSSPIWGEMGDQERRKALEAFKLGQLQILTSCNVLCEGYDEPSASAIVMARPTKSQSLYIQCIGRGLRVHPGKSNCLVLDFTDKSHNLDSVISLTTAISEAARIIENEEEEKEGQYDEVDRTPKIRINKECNTEFDVLGSARFSWVDIGDGEWSLIDDDRKEIVLTPQENGYVAKLYHLDGASHELVRKPIPLQYCFGCAEDYARKNLKTTFANPRASWMQQEEELSIGQREFLEKNHAFNEEMTKAEASNAIRKIVAIQNKKRRQISCEGPTCKQRYFLNCRGISTSGMNKFQAMQTISKIKQSETSNSRQ